MHTLVASARSLAVLVSAGSFLLISACSTSKAVLLHDQPACSSSLEGSFHTPDVWSRDVPALVVKDGYNDVILFGSIVALREDGIVFDPARESPVYDPKPALYATSDIVVAVDSNRQVIAGKLPEKYSQFWAMDIRLTSIDEPESEELKIKLRPNEQFGFCVAPGDYLVSDIYFYDAHENLDRGVSFPELRVTVAPNASNYVGDLVMDVSATDDSSAINIPYKIIHRSSSGALPVFIVPGASILTNALLGAAQGALYGLAQQVKGAAGIHQLVVGRDEHFKPVGTRPRQDHLLTLVSTE